MPGLPAPLDYADALVLRCDRADGFGRNAAFVVEPPVGGAFVELFLVLDGAAEDRGARDWMVRLPVPGSTRPSPWTPSVLGPDAWARHVVTWLEAQVQARFPRWVSFVDDGVVRQLELDERGLVPGSARYES